jgi:hypothetical protein
MDQLTFWLGTSAGLLIICVALFVFVEMMIVGRRLEASESAMPSMYDVLDLVLNYAWVAAFVFYNTFIDGLIAWFGISELSAFVLYAILVLAPLAAKFMLRRQWFEGEAEGSIEERNVDFRFAYTTYPMLAVLALQFFLVPSGLEI